MFFMGTYTPKLDDKGRLILPAKFRDQLAEGLVVTQGQEKCLDVWPESDFMAEAERAKARGHDLEDGPRLRPHAVRQRRAGRPRQAGPDLDHAVAARVRRAHPRRGRDRRDGPRRDLGADPLARVLRAAQEKFAELDEERSAPS